MRPLRDLPIKQKLLAILMVITAVALLVSGTGIVLLDAYLFRATMRRDLLALASIVGDNSTAALTFDDPRVATETLGALRARAHIVDACIYRADGTVFARYSRAGAADECPSPDAGEAIRFTSVGLTASHPIALNGRRVGTLVLVYDLGESAERIRLYGAMVVVILIGSSLIAFALSSRLRAIIVTPILGLAHAAMSVSETGDYSLRVTQDSRDEVGHLVTAFNEMLGRIQSRDLEVQNARNLLQTTLTSIGDAVISTDVNGRVVFANPVARSMLGWPEPEITGRHIDEVFHIVNEFSRVKVESPVERVIREGAIVGLANHTVLIARDGTEMPIEDSGAPIRQGGRTIGVVLVFRDISERRRAQQDAAYLAAIVESSDDAIIGTSPDGIVQSWNSGAERLYGYKAGEMIGHSMMDLLPPERRHEEVELLQRLRSGAQVVHSEGIRVRKDGTLLDVAITASLIRDKAGQLAGISRVARDITEEKRNAEHMRQTQKLESLGVLAGGIAHDFNNLLTGILGNASLAQGDLPRESPARAAVDAVIAASERAAQLARQMLAYSGKGRFILEQIDLSARVRDTLPLIKAAIPSTIEVQLQLDDHLPPVEADAAQIQQLVMNIIINGAEAVPEGMPGKVTIRTRREQVDGNVRADGNNRAGELAPGPYVVLEVADTGSGMDEATRARIFDPFFTTKFTGRGLGLAAVLGIVRGHRGSIQVSSAPGKGTQFRVLLPAGEEAPAGQPALAAPEAVDLRGGGLVLVVDDEQIVLRLAKQALERYGYTVLLAEDGAQGLAIYHREVDHIQCVVLDLTMPVMTGEETLSHMKAVRSDIPIILSSGFNEQQAVRRFEGKGLAGFLQKPYKATALVEKIKEAIAQSGRPVSGRPL